MMLKKQLLEKVKKQITDSFPELKGVIPIVTTLQIPPQRNVYSKLKTGAAKRTHTHIHLRYRKKFETADGFAVTKIVKVSVSEDGEVLKITTSR